MNILLVDDEALSVDGIAAALDWPTLGIGQVYKAYSMAGAQEVFSQSEIDIMICDIEMPKGTGLSLMEWVRGEGFETVCIFLTCYSRFDYASSAIKLRIFDYVLKPCEYSELAEVVRRAVAKVHEEEANRRKQQQGEYWDEDYDRVVTGFWEQLAKGTLKVDAQSLPRQLELHHLDHGLADKTYYLLLLQAVPDKDLEGWDQDLWSYAVRNIVMETLDTPLMLGIQENRFMAVKDAEGLDMQAFEDMCTATVRALRATLPAEFFGYFGAPCGITGAQEAYKSLKKYARDNFALQSMVFRQGEAYTSGSLPEIDVEHWQNALLLHNTDMILDEVRGYLSSVGRRQIVDRSMLQLLYHQLLNAVYFVLELHHLPAHQPFLDTGSATFENAFNSLPDFEVWVEDILENTNSLVSSREASSSLVDTLRKYIRENLNNDLSRAKLAGVVHLHPDYLSALFREKSGYSLSEFITKERIGEAKKLLLSTDLPINEIAIRTGFQNISYFSKQFKRMENQTPLQYRKGRQV